MAKFKLSKHKVNYGYLPSSNCDRLIEQIGKFYQLHDDGKIKLNSADLRTILAILLEVKRRNKYIPTDERYALYSKFYELEGRYINNTPRTR